MRAFALLVFLNLSGSLPVLAASDHHVMEEIIVTAPFGGAVKDTALPVGVLFGEALAERNANSLGETLKRELGVHSASFGTGVGQPVIRGQSGKRVQVLQNGISVSDASAVSPDHANGAEAALASRIEVLRGPSTLLYGNGAIGGVVNVVDTRIPESLVSRPELVFQQTWDSGSDERKSVVNLEAASGSFGFRLDAFRRESNNVHIPGFAIDEGALELLEDPDGDHDELPNTFGFIDNSESEARGVTAGMSFVEDKGFIGLSVARLRNNYGLPPGTHSDHQGDPDPDAGPDEEHGEDLLVRIDMEQTRYDIKGELDLDGSIVRRLSGDMSVTRYEHGEVEIGEGTASTGTLYRNESIDGRIVASHAPLGGWNGVAGVQFGNSEFSATGEEAFIPVSDLNSFAIFVVERLDSGPFTYELGLRSERSAIDPSPACKTHETTRSASASVLYDISPKVNIFASVGRSERAPTIEERFSNIQADICAAPEQEEDLVLHAATGLFEVGNPDLGKEGSTNLELGFRQHSGDLSGEINLWYNRIDDYIYLDLEDDHAPIANYGARDASFRGVEASVEYPVALTDSGTLSVRGFGDLVRARFRDGADVPRIPPARVGAEFRYSEDAWTVNLSLSRASAQRRVGEDELPAAGYTLLSLYADYHWTFGNESELLLFLRGENLLDEEIRNVTSFLRHFSPEPGRSVKLGVKFSY